MVALRNFFLSQPSPQPASTVCRFDIIAHEGMSAGIDLRDMRGVRVYQRSPFEVNAGASRIEVPVSGLAPGAYVIRFDAGGESMFRTVVVDR